jgi:23S rRNA (uridine2552-2'-O)-methyltransferase
MQYIIKVVGKKGLVIGVDITKLEIPLKENMFFVHSDINELDVDRLGGHTDRFDVICSDMAPKTTGIKSVDANRSYQLCQMAEWVAQRWLKKGGHTVVKIFQGAPLERFIHEMKQNYRVVKRHKPKSSRNESVEIFVLGIGKK